LVRIGDDVSSDAQMVASVRGIVGEAEGWGRMKSTGSTATRLGTLLRSARASQGFTLEQMAERTHLSVTTLSNVETGKAPRPSRRSLAKLAMGYGVSADLLGAAVIPDGAAELRRQAQWLRERAAELERFARDLEGENHEE
jgi:transcriptional regulator with XRE-family HTH domain